MILCFAIFFLGHFATASDSSLCDYSCTPGGGCVVAYVGPSRFPFDDCCGFDGDDIYIMMQCLSVCLSRKMSIFFVGFSWVIKVVSWFFMVFGWFSWFFKVVSWFWLVNMVFQGIFVVLVGFNGFSR